MENTCNLLPHTKHETTHFDVLSDRRQTVKVSFLPFAGKINVKLNLSKVSLSIIQSHEHNIFTVFGQNSVQWSLEIIIIKGTLHVLLRKPKTQANWLSVI